VCKLVEAQRPTEFQNAEVSGAAFSKIFARKELFSNDRRDKSPPLQTTLDLRWKAFKDVYKDLAPVKVVHGTERQVKKRHLCAIFIQNASFYQDRLGTNIGKALKKRVAFP
jgi:hypothetical protein